MNTAFRTRLVVLLVAIVAVALLTLWGVQEAHDRIGQLESSLTEDQIRTFRIADTFHASLLRLNNHILRYAAWREPGLWDKYVQESDELKRWIDHYDSPPDQDPPQPNYAGRDREHQLIAQLNDAFDEYRCAAQAVRSNQPPARLPAETTAHFNEFERQSQRLLQLGMDLANAHGTAQKAFLADANRSLDILRVSLFAGVAFLLFLVATMGVVLYRDLIAPLRTRLVRSEELLVHQEKLATLGTLAAGIAHEIRNPLTSIKARLYTLNKHLKGSQPGAADAAIIADEIARLERIVQDVLQFARPSDPQLKNVQAQAVLREVQTLMAAALEKNGVQLRLETGPDLQVSMDPALIKQVLVNLVRNAGEAIHDTGTVTLRVRADRMPLARQERPVAVLEVIDTGHGIPPEVEKRLFDPFFTTKEAGTGLGLSIAARIVEKHGGALQHHTRVGHGTTFGVVLPLSTNEPNADPARMQANT